MANIETVTHQMQELNNRGAPVIFMVTGNNSVGKTRITKQLICELPFYQSINLGLASKMIRFFRPDIDVNELENFDHNVASELFKRMTDFMVNSYQSTGVNVIFDGVQIDPEYLLGNDNVLGGVILSVTNEIAIQRGQNPETHFNRAIDHLKQVEYTPNRKFQIVENGGKIEDTMIAVRKHLNRLLEAKLKRI